MDLLPCPVRSWFKVAELRGKIWGAGRLDGVVSVPIIRWPW
jgi:hypothetical protein